MVIRPKRPRSILSDKKEYDKLFDKSKNLQPKKDIFKYKKYLKYVLIFSIFGMFASKISVNNIFMKKSTKTEIEDYSEIEKNNEFKEFKWMYKILDNKTNNNNNDDDNNIIKESQFQSQSQSQSGNENKI